jgi:capsular exopolysaccharide synthesis family protein
LAEAGLRVCLIEADLRKPSLADALGIVGDAGLTSVLIGRASLADVVQTVGDNLEVLVAGAIPPNPSELLNSEAFRHTLRNVRTRVDTVVIDTAPLLPVADGAQIASLADATLLVVRAGKTTRDQITRAIETLANVDVTPVGVILSMGENRRGGGYYYYQEYRPNRRAEGSTETASEKPTEKAITRS